MKPTLHGARGCERDREAGLTLVELMLVVGLSAVVVLAAVQIHSTISSQLDRTSRISDAQQTLRAAMEVIERYVRLSGRYLSGNNGLVTRLQAGAESDLPILNWTDGGNANADILSVLIGNDASLTFDKTRAYSSNDTPVTGDPSLFHIGDLIALDYFDTTSAPPTHHLCVKQLTAISGTGFTTDLVHSTSSNVNPSAGQDICSSKMNSSTQPAYARLIGRSGAVFRINTTDDPRVPYLEMDPDGEILGATNGGTGFQRLAPHVEDLQFAFQLSKTVNDKYPDLTAPNQGWVNVGPLNADQLSRVRNVRITLVGRVPREESGMFFNPGTGVSVGKGERPAAENRLSATGLGLPVDGFVRRRMESIVQVRNLGIGL